MVTLQGVAPQLCECTGGFHILHALGHEGVVHHVGGHGAEEVALLARLFLQGHAVAVQGLRQLRDLLRLPRKTLARRFGPSVPDYLERLLGILDRTATAMGARLLRRWRPG